MITLNLLSLNFNQTKMLKLNKNWTKYYAWMIFIHFFGRGGGVPGKFWNVAKVWFYKYGGGGGNLKTFHI